MEEPKKQDLARGEVLLESSDEEEEKQQTELDANNHQEEETQGGPRTARLAIVNLDWDHVRAHHLYKICASLVSPTAPLVRASTSSLERRSSHHQESESAGQVNVVRGKVLSVRVYPSDFGKERMAREEKEGPPSEIFKKKDLIAEEVDEKNVYDVGGEDDYDEDALRQYQLERLR